MRRFDPLNRLVGILVLSVSISLTALGNASSKELPDLVELVSKNSAAVVNISTSQRRRSVGQQELPKGFEIPDLPEDSPFRDFFKRFFGEGEIEEFDSQSLGSGFIISDDGYVISNFHVIKDADEIIVRLSDRREFKAKLVGGDERSDIALLKIEASGLPKVKIGKAYELQVGEWVLAIGSPFGFDHSVTQGIVSAKGRSLPRENYVPFIQTDVAINPGNSGGPLFNLRGEVVGVNSQIFSRTGGFMGLSFAIPIDVAMDVADQLRSQGRVSRGWLGVLIQDVTRELAESFGMDKPKGALIAKVLPGSPAANAGIEVGDVVLAFNKQEVMRSSDLPPIVGRTRVGAQVPVEILRNGDMRTLRVLTAELPAENELRAAVGGAPAGPSGAVESRLGITVSDPTSEQRKEYDLTNHGVIVTAVKDGPAKRAGVREGDVVLMLNNQKVTDSQVFEKLSADLSGGKAASVLVQRQGSPIFLAIRPEE